MNTQLNKVFSNGLQLIIKLSCKIIRSLILMVEGMFTMYILRLHYLRKDNNIVIRFLKYGIHPNPF